MDACCVVRTRSGVGLMRSLAGYGCLMPARRIWILLSTPGRRAAPPSARMPRLLRPDEGPPRGMTTSSLAEVYVQNLVESFNPGPGRLVQPKDAISPDARFGGAMLDRVA